MHFQTVGVLWKKYKGTKEQWSGSIPNPTSNGASRNALALVHEHISQEFYQIKMWTRKNGFLFFLMLTVFQGVFTFLQMHRAYTY